MNNGNWFASCYLADSIYIPHYLITKLKSPERGEFYRIKCSKQNGHWKAFDINPYPVHPKNFKVLQDNSLSLQVGFFEKSAE